jgi:hydroxymethylglutaryl-CoA synthase
MPYTSLMLLDRQKKENLSFHGNRCIGCGFIAFPKSRVCPNCGEKDNFEDHKLSRRGTIFTYTKEHLYPVPEKPMVMAVIDLEGGGRFFTHVTDCNPDEVSVGMPVELTFRMFHESGGFYNYSWKCRPVAKGGV